MATVAEQLAEFAVQFNLESAPTEVQDRTLTSVVDTAGVCMAALSPEEQSGGIVRRLSKRWHAAGGASVIGIEGKVVPQEAALLNGSLAQALEMDDKHGPSLARPGSTITPAVLAVAEIERAPLREALEAIAVGYEVMIRLGLVASDRFLERGYHTSALLGGFGAAAAVSKLRGLAPELLVDALGIAGTFASGIQEATRTGSLSKIVHGGWGAQAGIHATELASAGITGPASVFEGAYGFFRTHLSPIEGALDWDRALDGLNSEWHLTDTAIKPYPCCQLLHAFIEASVNIRREMAAAGESLSAIERIDCYLAEPGRSLVSQPENSKRFPAEPHEARFSLPYVVSAGLRHGRIGLDTFHPMALREDDSGLSALVNAYEDPESDYPRHCPAYMEVRTSRGLYSNRVPYHPGCAEAPIDRDGLLRKFERNTSWLLGDEARERGEAMLNLDFELPASQAIEMLLEARPHVA